MVIVSTIVGGIIGVIFRYIIVRVVVTVSATAIGGGTIYIFGRTTVRIMAVGSAVDGSTRRIGDVVIVFVTSAAEAPNMVLGTMVVR